MWGGGHWIQFNHGCTFSCREIGSTNRALLPWLLEQRHKHNKACCPLEGVRPSPQQVKLNWDGHKSPSCVLFLFFFFLRCPGFCTCWANALLLGYIPTLSPCFFAVPCLSFRDWHLFLMSLI